MDSSFSFPGTSQAPVSDQQSSQLVRLNSGSFKIRAPLTDPSAGDEDEESFSLGSDYSMSDSNDGSVAADSFVSGEEDFDTVFETASEQPLVLETGEEIMEAPDSAIDSLVKDSGVSNGDTSPKASVPIARLSGDDCDELVDARMSEGEDEVEFQSPIGVLPLVQNSEADCHLMDGETHASSSHLSASEVSPVPEMPSREMVVVPDGEERIGTSEASFQITEAAKTVSLQNEGVPTNGEVATTEVLPDFTTKASFCITETGTTTSIQNEHVPTGGGDEKTEAWSDSATLASECLPARGVAVSEGSFEMPEEPTNSSLQNEGFSEREGVERTEASFEMPKNITDFTEPEKEIVGTFEASFSTATSLEEEDIPATEGIMETEASDVDVLSGAEAQENLGGHSLSVEGHIAYPAAAPDLQQSIEFSAYKSEPVGGGMDELQKENFERVTLELKSSPDYNSEIIAGSGEESAEGGEVTGIGIDITPFPVNEQNEEDYHAYSENVSLEELKNAELSSTTLSVYEGSLLLNTHSNGLSLQSQSRDDNLFESKVHTVAQLHREDDNLTNQLVDNDHATGGDNSNPPSEVNNDADQFAEDVASEKVHSVCSVQNIVDSSHSMPSDPIVVVQTDFAVEEEAESFELCSQQFLVSSKEAGDDALSRGSLGEFSVSSFNTKNVVGGDNASTWSRTSDALERPEDVTSQIVQLVESVHNAGEPTSTVSPDFNLVEKVSQEKDIQAFESYSPEAPRSHEVADATVSPKDVTPVKNSGEYPIPVDNEHDIEADVESHILAANIQLLSSTGSAEDPMISMPSGPVSVQTFSVTQNVTEACKSCSLQVINSPDVASNLVGSNDAMVENFTKCSVSVDSIEDYNSASTSEITCQNVLPNTQPSHCEGNDAPVGNTSEQVCNGNEAVYGLAAKEERRGYGLLEQENNISEDFISLLSDLCPVPCSVSSSEEHDYQVEPMKFPVTVLASTHDKAGSSSLDCSSASVDGVDKAVCDPSVGKLERDPGLLEENTVQLETSASLEMLTHTDSIAVVSDERVYSFQLGISNTDQALSNDLLPNISSIQDETKILSSECFVDLNESYNNLMCSTTSNDAGGICLLEKNDRILENTSLENAEVSKDALESHCNEDSVQLESKADAAELDNVNVHEDLKLPPVESAGNETFIEPEDSAQSILHEMLTAGNEVFSRFEQVVETVDAELAIDLKSKDITKDAVSSRSGINLGVHHAPLHLNNEAGSVLVSAAVDKETRETSLLVKNEATFSDSASLVVEDVSTDAPANLSDHGVPVTTTKYDQGVSVVEDEKMAPTFHDNNTGPFSDKHMKMGTSEVAERIIKEIEQISSNSRGQTFEIDGQIISDSDNDLETDEESENKELLDSAALRALLRAATGADSGENFLPKQSNGPAERPAGLGSAAPSLRPAARNTRSSTYAPSELAMASEDGSNIDDEERNLREKVHEIRVKFLRLVQRLGHSPEDTVAAQVLYRLNLAEGIRSRRQNNRSFSFENAKKAAAQLESSGSSDLDFSFNVLVLGKTGVGKSATINSIFNEAKSPVNAFAPTTSGIREISGMVDGVKICVIDTPGLSPSVIDQGSNHKILLSIKKFTKKHPPDTVLYVDRLDARTRDFNDIPLLRSISTVLGSSIWLNTIVALTHAASAPPDGSNGSPLSYEVFVAQRSHVVQHTIRQAAGDMRLMNPVTLVENHRSCRKSRGQSVLPNGQIWRSQLLLLCYSSKILSEANALMKLPDASAGKFFGFRFRSPPLPFLLSSLLQSRSHPKVSADQGGEGEDSDIDLDEFSDSDYEGEDEYVKLPPFKPLRKTQVAKLSKEQRNAYFDEYDYRIKLLQKTQFKAEIKRLKELKKRGKKQKNSAYKGGENELDPDNAPPADGQSNSGEGGGDNLGTDGAAPANVPVPLPDMVLPPSFDGDNPVYRYRFLEPISHLLVRPVLDTHGWDHDCGYDGVSVEESTALAGMLPAALSLQITKDKKEFNVHLESSVSAKHGESGSSMAGFDIQSLGKQLAYILRGETKFKNLRRNKFAAGASFTFFGENVASGVKLEDQMSIGKCFSLIASTGGVRVKGDTVYGANLEARFREKDYPIGQDHSTLGLSLMRWRGDLALGANLQSQFSVGRNSKLACRVGLNNKLSGQVTLRASSSDHLQIAMVGLLPLVSAIFKTFTWNESFVH